MNRTARRLARRWARLGTTTRLMTVYGLLLVLVMGAIVYQSDHVTNQRLDKALRTDLADEFAEYTNAIDGRPPGQNLTAYSKVYLQSHTRGNIRLLIIGLHGAGAAPATPPVLATAGARFVADVPRVRAWVAEPPGATRFLTVRTGRGTFYVLANPLFVGGTRAGTFVSAANVATISPDRSEQSLLIALEGLGALLAALAGGYLLLRRVLRTVNRVTRAAQEARSGDLAHRLSYTGPDDEVGRLARTMDEMLSELDSAFSAQRRLLADVSHQLRTPLTVARGHLEVLARSERPSPAEAGETAALVIDELTQMSLMVERLLLLGQAMEPDFLLEESVDLPAMFDELAEAARAMASRRWSIVPPPAVAVTADRAKLRGALLNLIDNAVKATSENDSITVRAAVDGGLVLEVADTGKGIPDAEQPHIFDRFRRSATSAYGGTGLGLAIVKAVAEAHHGRVELDSAVGHGTAVRIILPEGRVTRRPTVGTGASQA